MKNNKNFYVFLLSNIVYAASQWLFILTTLKIFGTEKTGEITLCLAINAPVFLLFNMQLKNDYIKTNDQEKFHEYFYGRIITNVISLTIVGIYTIITNDEIKIIITTLIIAIIKCIEGVSEICQSRHQIDNEYTRIAKSTFIKSIGYIFTYPLISIVTGNIYTGLTALIIHQAITYYIIDKIGVKSQIKNKQFTLKSFKTIAFRTYKLGFGSALDSLTTNGQRIIIANRIGLEALGTYAPLTQLIVIPQIFLTSIYQYQFPKIQKNKNSITIIYGSALIVGIAIVLLSMIFENQILKIMFDDYELAKDQLLIIISICGLSWYLSGAINTIEIANGKYTSYTLSVCISLITTILCTYIFIETQKLSGAGLALLIGYITRIGASFLLRSSTIK